MHRDRAVRVPVPDLRVQTLLQTSDYVQARPKAQGRLMSFCHAMRKIPTRERLLASIAVSVDVRTRYTRVRVHPAERTGDGE